MTKDLLPRIQRNLVIITLITDDISPRLKPVCGFLSKRYPQITILFFDYSNGKLKCNNLIDLFEKEGYKAFIFHDIKEGLTLINKNQNSNFLYLFKSTQNLGIRLYYLFFKTKSSYKWISQCNLILIRRVLSEKSKNNFKYFLPIVSTFKNFLLHSLFYLKSLLVYFFLFNPLLHIIRDKKEKTAIPTNPQNILFIRMDHLGDIICTLPSLKALKEKFPNSKITFLGAPWSCQPLKANPHLFDELIIWDAPWHNKKTKYKIGIKEFIKLMLFLPKLRRKNFDLVIQPRGEGMNVVLAALTKGNFIISCADANRPIAMLMKKFIDILIVLNPYRTYHISEWPQLCLKELGIQVKEHHIRECYKVYTSPEIEKEISKWKKQGFNVCSIVIGAGSKVREWSPYKFSKLIEKLFKKNTLSILIGSKDDIRRKDNIVKLLSIPVMDMVGKTDFKNISCILENSDFIISLDTSIMHLASLLNKKIIALFGAGNIGVAKPVFSKKYVIIKKELGCSGCGDLCLFKKDYAPCMKLIRPEEVLERTDNML